MDIVMHSNKSDDHRPEKPSDHDVEKISRNVLESIVDTIPESVELKMQRLSFIILLAFLATASSFGGEDKFLKKYAMMKIYESCFGEDVVRQIRKEMRQACAKCSSLEAPGGFQPPAPPSLPEDKPHPEELPGPNSVYQPAQQPSFDVEKLHQAILAFRPNPQPQPSFRPFPGVVPQNFYGSPFGSPQYSFAPPNFYPGYQQVPPFSPYNFPVMGQQFYGTRMSRDMDLKNQMDFLTSRMSGRVRNVTCVMQELGYLDDNLEPNYPRIQERIGNLPVSEDLRKDMQEGVAFCQQFSQCVPEVKKEKSPLSRELIRPMFFFKCYKHKKLEACIMKDVREKFSGVSEEEFESEMELRRTGKSAKLPKSDNDKEIDDLAASVYEFLYASDSNLDVDSLF